VESWRKKTDTHKKKGAKGSWDTKKYLEFTAAHRKNKIKGNGDDDEHSMSTTNRESNDGEKQRDKKD